MRALAAAAAVALLATTAAYAIASRENLACDIEWASYIWNVGRAVRRGLAVSSGGPLLFGAPPDGVVSTDRGGKNLTLYFFRLTLDGVNEDLWVFVEKGSSGVYVSFVVGGYDDPAIAKDDALILFPSVKAGQFGANRNTEAGEGRHLSRLPPPPRCDPTPNLSLAAITVVAIAVEIAAVESALTRVRRAPVVFIASLGGSLIAVGYTLPLGLAFVAAALPELRGVTRGDRFSIVDESLAMAFLVLAASAGPTLLVAYLGTVRFTGVEPTVLSCGLFASLLLAAESLATARWLEYNDVNRVGSQSF